MTKSKRMILEHGGDGGETLVREPRINKPPRTRSYTKVLWFTEQNESRPERRLQNAVLPKVSYFRCWRASRKSAPQSSNSCWKPAVYRLRLPSAKLLRLPHGC